MARMDRSSCILATGRQKPGKGAGREAPRATSRPFFSLPRLAFY